MQTTHFSSVVAITIIMTATLFSACETKEASATDAEQSATEKVALSKDEMIKKGEYLVLIGGCHDCHSPKEMTEHGPEPDMSRALSGHPKDAPIPEVDLSLMGDWVLMGMDLTAFVGPWGMSFAANLTPHDQTGLGGWDEDIFIKALQTGKHAGVGRPILPPMPWFNFGKMEEEDLKALFAYLQSIPAVDNKVPEPIPMDQLATTDRIKIKGKASI